MECHDIENLLSPYLEDTLDPQDKKVVDQHLKSCPLCAELLNCLQETNTTLSDFPEFETSQNLLTRLESISQKRKSYKISLDFLTRPAFQPVIAVASIILLLFSVYFFHPNRNNINKMVNRQIHAGYSKVEKLYAQTVTFASSLGEHKDNVLDSLKNIKLFEGKEE
jgi:predicted anti-sigma-YlaC factor YlaD